MASSSAIATPSTTPPTTTTTTLLRVEKALLRGKWDDEIPSSLSLSSNENNETNASQAIALCKLAVEGRFREVLVSDAARGVFRAVGGEESDEERPFVEVFGSSNVVNAKAGKDDEEGEGREEEGEEEEELSRLAIAISCLHAFIQANWTGPELDFTPSELVVVAQPTITSNTNTKKWTDEILQAQAIAELARGGEPAYHLAKAAFLLRMAEILLVEKVGGYKYKHLKSVGWWRVRAERVHQQILDEPVPSPTFSFSLADEEEDADEVKVKVEIETMGDEPDLAGRMYLERGVLDHVLGRDKTAGEYFVRAARATGMEYELTGAMGRRTKFQVKDLSQLVLLAESRLDDVNQSLAVAGAEAEAGGAAAPETLALNDDTLLEQTEYTSSRPSPSSSSHHLHHIDPSNQPPLHPLDQAILLSLCLNVHNTSPSHGLTSEQMSAYVARVIMHPRNWSVHTMALLLRARLESTRTRTVERATLQLQALIDQMPTADSSVKERLMYFHAFPLPSRWVMEKELAGRYLSLGVVRSALDIYERLEMWEDVVRCYAALEKTEKAIGVVRDLLEGRKIDGDGKDVRNDAMRTAKLHCLLGDLDPSQAISHYTTAWTLSSHTSGRAMRSLGAFHFARAQYADAIVCLQRAVKINPLLSRSWFILGCACMREERWEEAREAFGRCVGIDEEDGESWNNLASMYLRTGGVKRERDADGGEGEDDEPTTSSKDTQPIPFTSKLLAFRALQQGLRHAYENWRMWHNFMIVSVDVGELQEACRALGRVVEQTGGAVRGVVDLGVVERLVDAVTREGGEGSLGDNGDEKGQGGGGGGGGEVQNPNEGKGLYKNVRTLFDRTLLPRISDSPRLFRAYARLLTWKAQTKVGGYGDEDGGDGGKGEGKGDGGEWEEVVKAYMDAYRCGAAARFIDGDSHSHSHSLVEPGEDEEKEQGQEEDSEKERWLEAVREVHDIVDVLRNYGPKLEVESGAKWRGQARSIVRRFMARTREVYEGEEEWVGLGVLLDELKS